MKELRKYIREILLEFRRNFRQSRDDNWAHGNVIFHFEKPAESDLYGPSMGNIHGFRSHAIKHFDEFVPAEKRNEIVDNIKQAIKANGYDKVWQQRKPTSARPNPEVTEIPVDRLTKKHILNGLDFFLDKFKSGKTLLPVERNLLNYTTQIYRIYVRADDDLDNEQATNISNANFPSKERLFEKLKEVYLSKQSVEFVIKRFDDEYLVKLNLSDSRYKSIENWEGEVHEQEQGTLMVLEKRPNRQTFRRTLTIWAPMRNGRPNVNTIPDEYSNFRELCQEAHDGNPDWGEWNLYNKSDGAP